MRRRARQTRAFSNLRARSRPDCKATVAVRDRRRYLPLMNDRSGTPPPQEWIDALAQAEAEVASGLTVPWAEAKERLLATLAEIEADRARRRA